MHDMIDIWTKLALAGAAVSFAAYLALRHARRIACISDRIVRIPRSRLAAFLLFAAVATVCAQKGGNTNTPPEGASSPRAAPPVRTDEGGGDVTNLCFAGISVSSNAVALSLAWPTNFFEDGACMDFFALEHEGGFQAGFWIGGNLPWNGLAASPTFENVRVRALYPETLYYGWHYYRDDGGASVISNCMMNAAGATNVIGVYSYGGPDVAVADCHFVNFPTNGGNYATYSRLMQH